MMLASVKTDIVYRALTAEDIPAARALWGAAPGVELAEGDSPSELLAYVARNPGMSQAAVVGSTLAAAVLAGQDGRRGYLYHLAVDARFQGRGIGRVLVERSLAALRQAGLTRALILVAADNAGGAAFWSRVGWEPLEEARPMGIDL